MLPYSSRTLWRFLGDVEGVGRLGLHAERHLERLDAGLELLFLVELLGVHRLSLRARSSWRRWSSASVKGLWMLSSTWFSGMLACCS